MPSRYWLVDEVAVELIDRGPMGVSLVTGDTRQPIPPMTIGAWPVAVAGRTVVLEAKRNLDAVRYQLVSDGHLVPRRSHPGKRDVPPSGTTCSADDAAAVTRCPRCTRTCCRACAPDGNHCSACLHALVADERAAIQRLRRLGVVGSFALTLLVVVLGVATRSHRVIQIGIAGTAFVGVHVVRMRLRERAEQRAP